MVNLECHDNWAPETSIWSPWVKPILFAEMSGDPTPEDLDETCLHDAAATDLQGLPAASGDDGLILDLPGAESVALGVALAGRGFRPVPLFNGTTGPAPAVDVQPILHALLAGGRALARLSLRADAPPVFLLDSNRAGVGPTIAPGRYDNRWVVLPPDMPSGNFLRSRGVHQVTLVRRGALQPATDLAHVLLRWQQQGVILRVIDRNQGQTAEHVRVSRPSLFRASFYAAVTLLGLRRNNMGGFGAPIPQQVARTGWTGGYG